MNQTTNYNKVNKNNSRPQILCPHCKKNLLKIRSSQQVHPLLKDIWLSCPNIFCAFTAKGHIEITHTCSASATPDPKIYLPTFLEMRASNDENPEHE
ncbi:ogr/Delta-like zinc finger family protein [Acinetobacter sp. MD2(2019)]|uniref:ogr/Delta-like zinc finger family protein n=1 Tax=Acinetobacter sp. MD2(2019) TaxID=2605273 RepID=UPI002D1F00F3|nr:ogr/Delta-like zinc finger family protein [Acinetobacter sp. MD2(2019)]MEB3754705.1 ogr/Delta-like zinc finger family protein [Acinetobacter sp. MD2(2019)]